MKLPAFLAALLVASLVMSVERCSAGADIAALHIETHCDELVDEALDAGTDVEKAIDTCLIDYESSPAFEASYQAFMHMTLFLVAALALFTGLSIILARRFFSRVSSDD